MKYCSLIQYWWYFVYNVISIQFIANITTINLSTNNSRHPGKLSNQSQLTILLHCPNSKTMSRCIKCSTRQAFIFDDLVNYNHHNHSFLGYSFCFLNQERSIRYTTLQLRLSDTVLATYKKRSKAWNGGKINPMNRQLRAQNESRAGLSWAGWVQGWKFESKKGRIHLVGGGCWEWWWRARSMDHHRHS